MLCYFLKYVSKFTRLTVEVYDACNIWDIEFENIDDQNWLPNLKNFYSYSYSVSSMDKNGTWYVS